MHDLLFQLRKFWRSTGGSPGRRSHISVGIGRPVTFSLVFTTSATEKPRPLPRLIGLPGLPAASQSMAAIGHGIRAKRSKLGAFSFDGIDVEANRQSRIGPVNRLLAGGSTGQGPDDAHRPEKLLTAAVDNSRP
jgi:hypothetical protein